MPFPFLAPLSPWIKDIMTQRESSPLMTSFKSPWVILTSPALVVKGSAEKEPEARKLELLKLILYISYYTKVKIKLDFTK